MESQKIAPNRVVSLSYSLALTNGQIADEATSTEPLVFIHGVGQTLSEFDARIEGLGVGEGFSFFPSFSPGVRSILLLWSFFGVLGLAPY